MALRARPAGKVYGEGQGNGPRQPPPLSPRRAPARPRATGHDCEFVRRPDSDLVQTQCPVCLLVLREPHQVTCCGYSFCHYCIQRVQTEQRDCPACGKPFTTFLDKRLKRTLYTLKVYCSHRKLGCSWEGELGQLEAHLNVQPSPDKLLEGCQWSEVECTYCIKPFQLSALQAHQSRDCPQRPFSCEHCKHFKASFEEVTQQHWLVCPFFPLACPNTCGHVVQRRDVEFHVTRDCPLAVVACDFQRVGCTVRLPRRDMSSHISETVSTHISLLLQDNATLRTDLQTAQDKLRSSEERVAQLETKSQAQTDQLSVHQQTLEKVMLTGTLPFDFTMTEFQEKKNNNDKWCSPPFYTHTHGYRMCIRVHPNGNGNGEDIHVSVFAYLMQGMFDDDLLWPFQGSITIQLLNQRREGDHKTLPINFSGITGLDVIGRVTTGARASNGVGTATFLRHTALGLSSDSKCQYLKDDQLKFRVLKSANVDLTTNIHRHCLKLESLCQPLKAFSIAIEPQVSVVPITFTLTDFEQQKRQDTEWYSPAFYTHLRGYRICLKLYPNGNGAGKGTHVSIYTYLLRGQFDCQLKWPFRGDITITVLDQSGEKHHDMAVRYDDRTPDTIASRPTDQERTDSVGIPKFLLHSSLDGRSVGRAQYLRFNSLQIRISKVKVNSK